MEIISPVLLSIPALSVVLHILAYIDPGTGSIILQALVAAVVGAGIVARLFWHRILWFLGFRKNLNPDTTDDETESEEGKPSA
jgi:hypothetical protein